MWGIGRKRRPVEFGPYPLERLGRDPSILEKEAAIPPREPAPIESGGSVCLVEAVKLHLGVYEELREPKPFEKKLLLSLLLSGTGRKRKHNYVTIGLGKSS